MLTSDQRLDLQARNQLLAQNMLDVGKQALQYLVLTNGGAAIACLAFMGSASPHAGDWQVRAALCFFIAGLFAAGITVMRGFNFAYRVTLVFQQRMMEVLDGTTEYDQFNRDMRALVDIKRAHAVPRLNKKIGSVSLACFVIGAVGACVWFWDLKLVKAEGQAPIGASQQKNQPVRAGGGATDISDLPYPAPPCRDGQKTCTSWQRDWKGTELPAGAVVTDDGTVWPHGRSN